VDGAQVGAGLVWPKFLFRELKQEATCVYIRFPLVFLFAWIAVNLTFLR
jgi:hypothetical protein